MYELEKVYIEHSSTKAWAFFRDHVLGQYNTNDSYPSCDWLDTAMDSLWDCDDESNSEDLLDDDWKELLTICREIELPMDLCVHVWW